MQRLLTLVVLAIIFSANAFGDNDDCTITVLVTESNANEVRQLRNLESPQSVLAKCIVVVRCWSQASQNEELGRMNAPSEKEADNTHVSSFDFKNEPPLNFAIVNFGDQFVLRFNAEEQRWPFIRTMFSREKLNERVGEHLVKAGFFCRAVGGPHRVVCLNNHNMVLGHVLAVPKFAEEYHVLNNGGTIVVAQGRVDVSVWLGNKWHSMRFSDVARSETLNLHFKTAVEKSTKKE